MIEGLYLRAPKPTVVWIYEQIVRLCDQGRSEKPSYTIVWEVCRDLDDRLKVLAHEGEDAYEQAYEIVIRREANHPNEMWQADHKELKIWAVDQDGRVGKVWITVILDDYSRMVPGYFMGIGPANSMRIASALRQAIWIKEEKRWMVCGIPEILYSDRGKDFKSNHIKQAAADLGITLVNTRPRRPKGRGKIERFFRTTNQRFSMQRKSRKKSPLPLEQVRREFHEWLLNDYNNKIHREIKQTPISKWKSGNFAPRVPESLEALDLMLQMVGRPRKMWRDGIRFNKRRYSDLLLSESVGVEFSIRYDPRDLSCIWVYGEEGRRFCKATCAELTGEKLDSAEIISTRTNIRRDLKTKVRGKRLVGDAALSGLDADQERDRGREAVSGDAREPARRLRKHFYERTAE